MIDARTCRLTGTLDNRFSLTVTRTGPYKGELSIRERDHTLLRENVGLSYVHFLGPPVGDVTEWQQRAAEFVDALGTS